MSFPVNRLCARFTCVTCAERGRRQKFIRCFLILLCVPGASADAGWHGQVNFLTNYFYRGYSKSRGNPVVQGNLEFEHESGWFTGFAVSPVSFDDKGYQNRASVELKPYLGWTFALTEDWHADVSATGYVYDGTLFGRDSEYAEFYAAVHLRDQLTVRLAFAPDAYQRGADTLNYELVGRYDVLDTVRLSVGLGYYQASAILGYDSFYWNAGVTWYLHRYVSADLRYVDTNADTHAPEHPGQFGPRALEDQILFSISVGF